MASDRDSCWKEGPLTAAGVAGWADAGAAGLAGEEEEFMRDYPGSGAAQGARGDSPPMRRRVGRDRLGAVPRHLAHSLAVEQGPHMDHRRLRLH